jgi:SNF2 family DNA or RNA helicase
LSLLLEDLHKEGRRVVIFSQYTASLDIIQRLCKLKSYKHLRLDGMTKSLRRRFLVDAFNGKGSPFFAFLMTTKAGGQGLNLQSANTVILYDSDWNPQGDLQAQDRVHRLGQTQVGSLQRRSLVPSFSAWSEG